MEGRRFIFEVWGRPLRVVYRVHTQVSLIGDWALAELSSEEKAVKNVLFSKSDAADGWVCRMAWFVLLLSYCAILRREQRGVLCPAACVVARSYAVPFFLRDISDPFHTNAVTPFSYHRIPTVPSRIRSPKHHGVRSDSNKKSAMTSSPLKRRRPACGGTRTTSSISPSQLATATVPSRAMEIRFVICRREAVCLCLKNARVRRNGYQLYCS